ncbi:MAG: hypothetical protein AAF732_11070 [Pseudomonadota bacterium]
MIWIIVITSTLAVLAVLVIPSPAGAEGRKKPYAWIGIFIGINGEQKVLIDFRWTFQSQGKSEVVHDDRFFSVQLDDIPKC